MISTSYLFLEILTLLMFEILHDPQCTIALWFARFRSKKSCKVLTINCMTPTGTCITPSPSDKLLPHPPPYQAHQDSTIEIYHDILDGDGGLIFREGINPTLAGLNSPVVVLHDGWGRPRPDGAACSLGEGGRVEDLGLREFLEVAWAEDLRFKS